MANILSELGKFENPLFIGPMPPPIGGVSVFMKRLINHIPAKIFDPSKFGRSRYYHLSRLLLTSRYDVVFLNIITIKYLVVLKFFHRGDIIVMDHNNRLFLRNRLVILIIKYFLSNVTSIHVVSETIKSEYVKQGVTCLGQIQVSYSFIPPIMREKDAIISQYPKELVRFIKSNRLILISGYTVKFLNGKDLYGFDVAIKLHAKLLKDDLDTKLLLVIPDMNSRSCSYIKRLLEDHRIPENSYYVLKKQIELWPLFLHANLFLRPTITDGYGISVAESVFLGCPALASDVCDRAAGAITYDVDNFNDFYEKAKALIS